MSDVTLHLGPVLDREALERVRSTLPEIKKDNQLVITMEAADAHQAGGIMRLLDQHGFTYLPRGSHDGNTYSIIAYKQEE